MGKEVKKKATKGGVRSGAGRIALIEDSVSLGIRVPSVIKKKLQALALKLNKQRAKDGEKLLSVSDVARNILVSNLREV